MRHYDVYCYGVFVWRVWAISESAAIHIVLEHYGETDADGYTAHAA